MRCFWNSRSFIATVVTTWQSPRDILRYRCSTMRFLGSACRRSNPQQQGFGRYAAVRDVSQSLAAHAGTVEHHAHVTKISSLVCVFMLPPGGDTPDDCR